MPIRYLLHTEHGISTEDIAKTNKNKFLSYGTFCTLLNALWFLDLKHCLLNVMLINLTIAF